MSELMKVEGIRKEFRPSGGNLLNVLKSVNLDIFEGDRIAIVGKSGAGKSTLLHILGALERPTSGKVSFMGLDLFSLSERDLSSFRNKEVGFVFQFHYLMFEFSALENVMMPALIQGVSKSKAMSFAKDLLDRVGLSGRLIHKPGQLSGGEQQRVAVARALMMNPKLLLTDEMTGNLDRNTGLQVFELVQSIYSEFKMALVSVTHDEAMVSRYQKVFHLTDGVLSRSPE